MLRLATDQDRCEVTPGTEHTVTVLVGNESELTEDVELEPLGARSEWCRIDPPVVRPSPGETVVATLVVGIPALAPADAGSGPLLIRARCLSDAAVTYLEVVVGPGGGRQPATTQGAGMSSSTVPPGDGREADGPTGVGVPASRIARVPTAGPVDGPVTVPAASTLPTARRPVPIWPALVVTVVILALVLGAVLLFGPEITPRPY